ncbi:sugar transferase [Erysipelothrix tonsillarum]|uniref:sugar transferase n=1 Tax=Erysipelothrix tonsillarum TaxID=38402 RepID=UPI0003695584|nr:sugar transferase [Erysipelothrix tonsillarum]
MTMNNSSIEENEDLKNKYRMFVKKHNYVYLKRFFDIILTLLFSPIIILIVVIFAIIVKLDSRGPAFYTQLRVGQADKEFKIYKLRSMRVDAEVNTGAVWAEKNDPRITKVGRFIRKVRIDELPQFLNVLIGDMSIIGPRPERKDLTDQFEDEIPGFKQRLLVKPGITGWAQVNGGYDITPAEKLDFDREYLDKFSLKQDVVIIFKTIRVVLTGSGAR